MIFIFRHSRHACHPLADVSAPYSIIHPRSPSFKAHVLGPSRRRILFQSDAMCYRQSLLYMDLCGLMQLNCIGGVAKTTHSLLLLSTQTIKYGYTT